MRKLTIWLLSAALTGCTYLENYFPDKEKDYQYTSEIPMLNWPAEIRKNKPVGSDSTISSNTSASPETAASLDPAPVNNTSENSSTDSAQAGSDAKTATPAVSPAEVITSESDDRSTITSVDVIKYDDGESRLRLGAGLAKAWRAVSKALSHNAIEVTERNHEQGLITLQYDPNEKKAKDDSIWDELDFIFHGINTNEEEYRLKLEEHNGQTDVLVLNQDHVPLTNNDNALQLLKVIAGTIKTDLADKDDNVVPPEPASPAQPQ